MIHDLQGFVKIKNDSGRFKGGRDEKNDFLEI